MSGLADSNPKKKLLVGHSSDDIFTVLHEAGVFTDDPRFIRRVIIDLEVNEPARVYVERYADESLGPLLAAGFKKDA